MVEFLLVCRNLSLSDARRIVDGLLGFGKTVAGWRVDVRRWHEGGNGLGGDEVAQCEATVCDAPARYLWNDGQQIRDMG